MSDTDLGTLVSERPTFTGFMFAMLDIFLMGCYLTGALVCIQLFGTYQHVKIESIAVIAVGLLLLEHWVRDWMRVTHPNGNYKYERKFVKDGVTTIRTGVNLWDDE
jgi:hypothetical protein